MTCLGEAIYAFIGGFFSASIIWLTVIRAEVKRTLAGIRESRSKP